MNAKVVPMVSADEPEKVIKVVLVTRYGQENITPACPTAELFCDLTNTKTLTRRAVEIIKRVGYRVEVVQTQPKEL